MSDETWHAGGWAASVIAAGGMAAMPAVGFVGMYGWWGVPLSAAAFLAIALCWGFIGLKTRQTRPETNAETSARTGKQFYAGLSVAMVILLVAMIVPGMFH